MRRDLPSQFEPTFVSGNATLRSHDVLMGGLYIIDTSGITLTLPAPAEAIRGAEGLVVNNSNGNATLAFAGGFANGGSTLTLAAGAGVWLYCAQVSGAVYRWASVGATAS